MKITQPEAFFLPVSRHGNGLIKLIRSFYRQNGIKNHRNFFKTVALALLLKLSNVITGVRVGWSMAKYFYFLVMISLFSCQQAPPSKPKAQSQNNPAPKTKPTPVTPTPKEPQAFKVSVMAYNLENFFDNVKDHDETPIADEVFAKKISQVAKGILQVQNGKGPDILFVEEVENINALNKLQETHLAAAGFKSVTLLESNDERGIDVGVISKYPVEGTPVLHKMPFSDVNPTRGILEVPLKLPNGKILRAFAVHFPSQANPVEQRKAAAELLRDLMIHANADYVVGGGDTNIKNSEEDREKIYSGTFKDFQVTHLIAAPKFPGSYFYKDHWDYLDAIFTREKVMLADTVNTPKAAATQLNENGSPKRFDKADGTGISDHLPIYVELNLQ